MSTADFKNKTNPQIEAPTVKPFPHRVNPPLSKMGQQLDEEMGIPIYKQDAPVMNSPQTESSLMILGAGAPYRSYSEVNNGS